MASVLTKKCTVCAAPAINSQAWPTVKASLNRSASAKRSPTKQDVNRPTTSLSKVPKTPIVGFEDAYIKQLQEQVFYLENECRYLREQLNRTSVLAHHTQQAELDRSDLQRSLIHTSSQADQLSSENHGLAIALDELRRKFDLEKQKLLEELDALRRSRDALDLDRRAQDQELRTLRERSRLSTDEMKTTLDKIRILEQQFEQQLNQNKLLGDELRRAKLESGNLQRTITDYQVVARDRDRLQGIVGGLENDIKILRQEAKAQDARFNDAQFLQSKLADEKAAALKELARLSALSKENERELNELRLGIRERTDALQSKDRELAGLRKKEQTFRSTVDNLQVRLDTELVKSQDLDGQLKQMQRQLNIEIQNALNSKRESNEFEVRNARLQEEINLLLRDKDQLTSRISVLQQQLHDAEHSANSLRAEMRSLEERVKEIDRLKSLEDLIQSQRWDDMSQMAQTMQSVSRTMARASSPTLRRKK